MTSSTPSIDPNALRQKDIQTLFTNITPRYDLLNSILSFRIDDIWRAETVRLGVEKSPRKLLDIGTGTGKLLATFIKAQVLASVLSGSPPRNDDSFDYCVGLDLCESMLGRAKQTVSGNNTLFACADALALPFREHSFDLIVSGFTLRSLPDLGGFFRESARILAAGGRIILLELTRPENGWLRAAYFPYLKFYLPLVGWIFSGDRQAYRFLSSSIASFKDRAEVLNLMSSNGFESARAISLTGGLATIFVAERK
ncbi:MAG: ubiquinone/menaquinone biosynthesis methyltransferase [Candidatus Omnitrophica bacterium]|nr:ubiquinone/menaquinone biosynthesis methyltransferase [Candidatus Omnitrophota bacterium]